MYALLCPQGHPVEDRTQATTNPGIVCRTCAQDYACRACSWTGAGPAGLLWVGSMELDARGIIAQGNPRDMGAYALCPCDGSLCNSFLPLCSSHLRTLQFLFAALQFLNPLDQEIVFREKRIARRLILRANSR